MVQVPELDVAVASSHKVGAVIREGDGGHLTGHLIGCYHHIFLVHKQKHAEYVNTWHTLNMAHVFMCDRFWLLYMLLCSLSILRPELTDDLH